MSESAAPEDWPLVQLGQPNDVIGLEAEARDRLVVFITHANGRAEIESRYGDSVWWPVGSTTNVPRAHSKLDFTTVPTAFQQTLKAITYRYVRRGASDQRRPKAATVIKFFNTANIFFQYVSSLGVSSLSDVTPLICSSFLQHQANRKIAKRRNLPDEAAGVKPARNTLANSQRTVKKIYALSKYTCSPMLTYPWPEKSTHPLLTKSRHSEPTPLMPNATFEALFLTAWNIVQEADELMRLRDELEIIEQRNAHFTRTYRTTLKNNLLKARGFDATYRTLKMRLNRVRTACYIVVASLSGCRNHELANLRSDCLRSTTDAEGNVYWWMRSVSNKTGAGTSEWMIPPAAVSAIRILKRWAEPAQRLLAMEIEQLAGTSPPDKSMGHPADHADALFLGVDLNRKRRVRTLSLAALNLTLKEFAVSAGVEWAVTSHQFRRKFANYAARSQFGDLRYLKEHYKHWSMDMTLGYALNDSQEMALYLEIQDELDAIKQTVVAQWLDDRAPLAGGYGKGLIEWRSKHENVILFKNKAAMVKSIAISTPIRSNGHSWCTAEDNLCIGNTVERTRCSDGCDNAVIARVHLPLYQGLYNQLKELEDIDDIGEGGMLRVKRDLARCRKVLHALSGSPIEAGAE